MGHLSARATDADLPDGDSLRYVWSAAAADGTVLEGGFDPQGTQDTTWTPPQTFAGDAVLTFAAVDSKGIRSAVDIRVNVDPRNALWPIYVAGDLNHHPDIKCLRTDDAQLEPDAETLVGADVEDADGDPLTYLWTSDCGGSAGHGSFDDDRSRWPRFKAPPSFGPCKLTVTVEDGRGGRNEGTIVLNVDNPRSVYAPQILVAFATPFYVRPRDEVALMIFARDPNGERVDYAWSDGGAGGTFEYPGDWYAPRSNVLWTPPACTSSSFRDTLRVITVELTNGVVIDGVPSKNRFTFPLVQHCP
jgi:hypothetical protein